jgi:hypothetical protein
MNSGFSIPKFAQSLWKGLFMEHVVVWRYHNILFARRSLYFSFKYSCNLSKSFIDIEETNVNQMLSVNFNVNHLVLI